MSPPSLSAPRVHRAAPGKRREDPFAGRLVVDRYLLGPPFAGTSSRLCYFGRDLREKREIVFTPWSSSEQTSNLSVHAEFDRRARKLSELAHPNLTPLEDWGWLEDYHFAVFERIRGESLASYLRRRAPLKLEDFVPLAMQLLGAVAAADEQEVALEPLCASDVMLTEHDGVTNFVKVTNLGMNPLGGTSGEGPALRSLFAFMLTSKHLERRDAAFALSNGHDIPSTLQHLFDTTVSARELREAMADVLDPRLFTLPPISRKSRLRFEEFQRFQTSHETMRPRLASPWKLPAAPDRVVITPLPPVTVSTLAPVARPLRQPKHYHAPRSTRASLSAPPCASSNVSNPNVSNPNASTVLSTSNASNPDASNPNASSSPSSVLGPTYPRTTSELDSNVELVVHLTQELERGGVAKHIMLTAVVALAVSVGILVPWLRSTPESAAAFPTSMLGGALLSDEQVRQPEETG